jgi:hypothetical protein
MTSALQQNLLLLTANDVPATKSIVQLPAPEAESIVKFFLATMYGGGQETAYAMNMNGNSIEASMIPGSTGISPSPTILQQQQQQHHNSDLYSNGNAIASLRTHSSKFPVSTRDIADTCLLSKTLLHSLSLCRLCFFGKC